MKMMSRLVVAVGLLPGLAAPAWADYQAGVNAYMRGDYETAFRELLPLAEQGDARAQWGLGFMYEDGEGVPQNYAEAVRWFRLAAEQGLAEAQFDMGWMYWEGHGVPRDYVLAHMWFDLAAAHHHEDAGTYRDRLAANMTPEQIAEAQRLAREWQASH